MTAGHPCLSPAQISGQELTPPDQKITVWVRLPGVMIRKAFQEHAPWLRLGLLFCPRLVQRCRAMNKFENRAREIAFWAAIVAMVGIGIAGLWRG
jgi:hypothetical protein